MWLYEETCFEHRAVEGTGPRLGTIVGCLLVLGAGVAAIWLRLDLPRPICHLREWTGVPCPTCGSSRMVEALLRGEVFEALRWNPLALLTVVLLALWAVASTSRHLLGLPPLRPLLESWERTALRLSAVVLLVAGWAYLIWRGV